MKPTAPTDCYCGSKAWAEAHAKRLQWRIGQRCPTTAALVTDIKAVPYGESKSLWGVAQIWQYHGRPDLGSFGGTTYLMLPLEVQ